MISIRKKHRINYNPVIHLTLPEISTISVSRFAGITFHKCIQKTLSLSVSGARTFSADSCAFHMFHLTASGTSKKDEFTLGSTNSIDSLALTLRGKATARLEGVGNSGNLLFVDDSVVVLTGGDNYKRLTFRRGK
jgi:hypothetical protein